MPFVSSSSMKKAALVAFFLACLALHARPAWANTPGVAATGVVTVLTSSVTGSASPQSVSVGSSLGCSVGGYIQVQDNSPEIAPIFSIPGPTQITAIFQNSHAAGANVICTLSVSAVNPLYGWTTYPVISTSTTAIQMGPNPSSTQSMYVSGNLVTTSTENLIFSLGTGGCSTLSTLFSVDRPGGGPFQFNLVVPPGNYLCLSQSLSSTTVEGYVNVLQE